MAYCGKDCAAHHRNTHPADCRALTLLRNARALPLSVLRAIYHNCLAAGVPLGSQAPKPRGGLAAGMPVGDKRARGEGDDDDDNDDDDDDNVAKRTTREDPTARAIRIRQEEDEALVDVLAAAFFARTREGNQMRAALGFEAIQHAETAYRPWPRVYRGGEIVAANLHAFGPISHLYPRIYARLQSLVVSRIAFPAVEPWYMPDIDQTNVVAAAAEVRRLLRAGDADMLSLIGTGADDPVQAIANLPDASIASLLRSRPLSGPALAAELVWTDARQMRSVPAVPEAGGSTWLEQRSIDLPTLRLMVAEVDRAANDVMWQGRAVTGVDLGKTRAAPSGFPNITRLPPRFEGVASINMTHQPYPFLDYRDVREAVNISELVLPDTAAAEGVGNQARVDIPFVAYAELASVQSNLCVNITTKWPTAMPPLFPALRQITSGNLTVDLARPGSWSLRDMFPVLETLTSVAVECHADTHEISFVGRPIIWNDAADIRIDQAGLSLTKIDMGQCARGHPSDRLSMGLTCAPRTGMPAVQENPKSKLLVQGLEGADGIGQFKLDMNEVSPAVITIGLRVATVGTMELNAKTTETIHLSETLTDIAEKYHIHACSKLQAIPMPPGNQPLMCGRFHLRDCSAITDLSPLNQMWGLGVLEIAHCAGIKSYRPLLDMRSDNPGVQVMITVGRAYIAAATMRATLAGAPLPVLLREMDNLDGYTESFQRGHGAYEAALEDAEIPIKFDTRVDWLLGLRWKGNISALAYKWLLVGEKDQ